eukprot:gene24469-29755_t
MKVFFQQLRLFQQAEHFLLDRDAWKIGDGVVARSETRWGPFDWEACADAHGENSQLRRLLSVRDGFVLQDWKGKHIFYCNPPFSKILAIVLHFLKEKRAQPVDTAVMFVLPFWTDYPFWKLVL